MERLVSFYFQFNIRIFFFALRKLGENFISFFKHILFGFGFEQFLYFKLPQQNNISCYALII
jgi:hypothetical protein